MDNKRRCLVENYMIHTSKRIFELLSKKDRFKFFVLFFLLLIATILEVIGVGIIPIFISAISSPDQFLNNSHAKPFLSILNITDSKGLLIKGGLLVVSIYFIKALYTIYVHYLKSKFIYEQFQNFSTKLFKKYLLSPYIFHLYRNSSELIRNLTTETSLIANNILQPSLVILMNGLIALGILILLLVVEPLITLATVGFLCGSGGLLLFVLKNKTQHYGKVASKERARMIQEINEGIGGLKEITIMRREEQFFNNFKQFVSNLKIAEIFKNLSIHSIKPVIEFIAITGMIIIAIVMFVQEREFSAIIAILTLFGAAAIRLMPMVSQIFSQLNSIRYHKYALDPVYNDIKGSKFDTGNKDFDNKFGKRINFHNKIKFENVSYSYPNSHEKALNDINFTIHKGDFIGLIGSSGAGKTTLVDTILGLLEPQSGRIIVDNIDMTDSENKGHLNFGYVPQFIFLSDDTLRNNIAFGLPENKISNEKIEYAVKASRVSSFINELQDGIHTKIGERGVRLSGGQRQRIGIARAIYNNPDILILDEATSALDNNTEQEILTEIELLRGKVTVIMIAHRMSTIVNCDKIYKLENGRIVKELHGAEIKESIKL